VPHQAHERRQPRRAACLQVHVEGLPIDLAFLLKRFSLKEIVAWYRMKYPLGSEYLVLRSLVYFDDAEDDPMPRMLKPMRWEAAKAGIQQAVREYSLA